MKIMVNIKIFYEVNEIRAIITNYIIIVLIIIFMYIK
jgi:hypothetical protein